MSKNGRVLELDEGPSLYCAEKIGLNNRGGFLKHARQVGSLVGRLQLTGARVHGQRASNPDCQLGKAGPSAARPCFVRANRSDGRDATESGEDLPNERTGFTLR